jgi:hypothetical protein
VTPPTGGIHRGLDRRPAEIGSTVPTSNRWTVPSASGATVRAVERDGERLVYLFGEEALVELDDDDLDGEDEIAEVVARFLPLPPGQAMAGAREAVRRIAVTQILDDDPPATWQAVERMREAGLDRDAVLSQLEMVISEMVMEVLSTTEPRDPALFVAALDALPMPTTEQIAGALVTAARTDPGIRPDELVERALAALRPGANERLVASLADEVLEQLVEGPLHWLADDATVVFHDTIAGRTFTHRLTDVELELGFLTVSVDLAAFGRFDVTRLADGTELDQFSVEAGHLAWSGRDGWLDGFQPGELIAVSAVFDPPKDDGLVEATITVDALTDEPPVTDEFASAVRGAYHDEQREHGLPVSTEQLIVWLCHRHPECFRSPLPPLSECCAAAGLEVRGNEVAHDDSVWRRSLLTRRLREVFDATPDAHWRTVLARAVDVLADPDASIDDVRSCLRECAEPEALDVLADVLIPELLAPEDEFLRDDVEAPGHVFDLVQRATAVARRPPEVASAEYLACVLYERCGQPLIAAEHLARAVDAQPRLGPVVERAGWYCFDRGDARGAVRWWRQLSGAHPALPTIEEVVAPTAGRARIARNDPCWCGSGRKFKQCHERAPDLPALPDRVGWLCRKAALWVDHSSGETRRMVTDLAVAWVAADADAHASDVFDDDESMQAELTRALSDPIVYDVALHEGGLFTRFVRERGDLLPDDERLLAAAWDAVDRSVHEVVSVEAGVGMELRNLASGEVVHVRERTASRAARQGERYCARVVPDGASHQIIGGVFRVRTGQEKTVLDLCAEADPFELCAWAGAVARPPRIVHQPGLLDSMIDRDAIQAALDDLGDADDAVAMAALNREIAAQAQARWLDLEIPALGGWTPRQAAADPTRREQVERLLDEVDRLDERMRDVEMDGMVGGPIIYDTAALRRELGLT